MDPDLRSPRSPFHLSSLSVKLSLSRLLILSTISLPTRSLVAQSASDYSPPNSAQQISGNSGVPFGGLNVVDAPLTFDQAMRSSPIPAGVSGVSQWEQALDFNSCTLSNLVSGVIL
jgi:hypothetical protein